LVIETLIKEKYSIIYAPEKSGKTSLLKRLQNEFLNQGLIAIRLDGVNLAKHDSGKILQYIESVFSTQFETPDIEIFNQLPRERKVILLDNFHDTRLKPTFKNKIIESLRIFASIIIITSAGDIAIDELLIQKNINELRDFKKYQILPFGIAM
jgi:GTPase SAR1 family protein